MAPWFFLSYGRNDDRGRAYVTRFYKELVDAVALKVGLRAEAKPEEIGYFDQTTNEPGDDWPEKIGEALRTCRTLVCLVSPSYLESEYCGKELTIFLERLERFAPKRPLLLPIIWDSPETVLDKLPQVFSSVQFPNANFGKIYAQEGLGYLLRLRQQQAIQKFLHHFALRLVKVASPPLPEAAHLRPLAEVKSALHSAAVHSPPSRQPNAGPRVARFVFFAGSREELTGIRETTDGYGSEDRDWCPYYPEARDSIGIISQGVASREKLFYENFAVAEDLVARIRSAENTNTVVLLLVDPWSSRVQRFQQPMRDFDQNSFLNCALIIPWNERDDETSRNRKILKAIMQVLFNRSAGNNNLYLRDHVPSLEELHREIAKAVGEIHRRMMQRAAVFQKIEGAETSLVPTISSSLGSKP